MLHFNEVFDYNEERVAQQWLFIQSVLEIQSCFSLPLFYFIPFLIFAAHQRRFHSLSVSPQPNSPASDASSNLVCHNIVIICLINYSALTFMLL